MSTAATSAVTVVDEAPVTGLSDLISQQTPEAPADSSDSGTPAADTEAPATDVASPEPLHDTPDPLDESSIFPQDGETDFADSVYQRAAEHYSKQFNVTLSPTDPTHRALLKEIIERGQKIASSQATTDEVVDEPGESDAVEQPPAVDTPEDEQKFLDRTYEYAGKMIRPAVANVFAKNVLTALFGSDAAKDMKPEGAVRFTQALTHGWMLMANDMLPQLIPNLIKGYVGDNFPMLADMHSDTIQQRAIKDLSATKDKSTGQLRYPGLNKMLESGAIESVYAENPELRGGQFYDPKTGKPLSALDNRKRELHVVYMMARGQQVNPALLQQVAEKGKQRAQEAQRNARAGNLAAGESKGAFPAGGDYFDELLAHDSNSPRNRWAAAVKPSEAFNLAQQRRAGRA